MVPRGTRTLCVDARTVPRGGHPAVPETFAGVANVRGDFPTVLDGHFRSFRHKSKKTFCRSRPDLAICVAGTRALRGYTNCTPRGTPSGARDYYMVSGIYGAGCRAGMRHLEVSGTCPRGHLIDLDEI